MNEQEIFAAALEQEAIRRATFLDEACAGDAELRRRIENLLKCHDQAGAFFEKPAADIVATAQLTPITETTGTQIGPYKLIEHIGEGGMGTVWMAQQSEPVKRLVAVKLIKAGMDSRQVIARFEAERQALALMDHTNIARVLDAGTTPVGRPYFVMDLVRGVPITQYCDEHHLTPRQRLELFTPVCQAIQHAHQKGIIHRDLKPNNVLVALYDGKPVPKVIDFGVAKATGQSLTEKTLVTGFGNIIGTLEYMSPEQAETNQLDIDTRSDIYSLGVLLYELLTGSTPFSRKGLEQAGMLEMLRVIREEEPSKPSIKLSTAEGLPTLAANRGTEPARLARLVRGELDWIVMKTLEKDRNRRYETAKDFAADMQRYLNDEPVLACPPSAAYRLRKFARRNKRALATAALLGVMLLAAVGAVAGSIGWAARDRAERRAAVDREVELALQEATRLQGQQKWPEALSAAKRAEALLANSGRREEHERRVRELLKDLNMVALLEEIRLQQSDLKGEYFDYAGTDAAYEAAFRDYGVDVPALEAAVAAERIRASAIREHLAAALDDWSLFKPMNPLWNVAFARDGHLLAVARLADPGDWRDRFRDPTVFRNRQALEELADRPEVASLPPSTVVLLGRALSWAGARAKAKAVLLAAQQRYPGDFWLNHQLAAVRDPSQPGAVSTQEAVGFLRAALAIRPQSPAAHANLAELLLSQGKVDEAIPILHQAIQLKPDYIKGYVLLGQAFGRQGAWDQAFDALQKGNALKPSYSVHCNLANTFRMKGDLDEAVTAYQQAIRLSPRSSDAHDGLGLTYWAMKDWDKAIAAYQEAIRLYPDAARFHSHLGSALWAKGSLDEAVDAFSKAIELNPQQAADWINRGNTHFRLRHWEQALSDYTQAIELKSQAFEVWHKRGLCRLELGDRVEAVGDLSRAIELKPEQAAAWNDRGRVYAALGEWNKAAADFSKAINLDAHFAWAHNELAWVLATCPDTKFRDPVRAIELAKMAVELSPTDGDIWHTLGVAYYRARDWKAAIAGLEKSMELRQGGDSFEWFFLAMAHWQLGEKDKARQWYDQAVQWMDKNSPNDEELRRFRSEAAELLEIKKD